MNAIILAAGMGTRLGTMGQTVPKALIEVGGRPLLERHLDYLHRHGIVRAVVNVHHLPAQIESFVRTYAGPLDVVCVFEERLLGTAGGVRNALAHLEPGPFLVLYGDIVVLDSITGMIELHHRNGALATLAVHEAGSADGKGVVDADESGRVTSFVEKEARDAGPVLINSGIYVLESDLLASVVPGTFSDFGRDVFPDALANGASIAAYRLARPVIDIGTPEGLLEARSTLAGGVGVGVGTGTRSPDAL